jgi:hypothetical protein
MLSTVDIPSPAVIVIERPVETRIVSNTKPGNDIPRIETMPTAVE